MDDLVVITYLNPEGLGLLHRARRADCHTNIRQMTKNVEAATGDRAREGEDPDAKRACGCRYAVTDDLPHRVTIQGSLQLG